MTIKQTQPKDISYHGNAIHSFRDQNVDFSFNAKFSINCVSLHCSHSFFVFELAKEHHEVFEMLQGKNENKIEMEQCLKFEYDATHKYFWIIIMIYANESKDSKMSIDKLSIQAGIKI